MSIEMPISVITGINKAYFSPHSTSTSQLFPDHLHTRYIDISFLANMFTTSHCLPSTVLVDTAHTISLSPLCTFAGMTAKQGYNSDLLPIKGKPDKYS